MNFLKSLVLLSVFITSLCSCDSNSKLSGRYEGKSNVGINVYMDFREDKVTANILGMPLSGDYKVKNDRVIMSFVVFGRPQELQAELHNDKLYFRDVVLEKNGGKSGNTAPGPSANFDSGVVFQDPILERYIRQQLNLPNTAKITKSICDAITFIHFDSNEQRTNVGLKTLADLRLFPNLRELYISQKMIQSTRNQLDITPVSSCPKLTTMTLIWCSIQSLAPIANMPSLQTIFIDNGDYSLDLKGINKCPALKSITLRNCYLTEVDRVGDIANLEYLDISNNPGNDAPQILDYSSLSNLKNLKYLKMRWSVFNGVNYDASFLNNMVNLEEFNTDLRKGLLGGLDEPKNFSLVNLRNLKRLTIFNCNIDSVLQQLGKSGAIENIEYLKIAGDKLTNKGMAELKKTKNLRELIFHGEIDCGGIGSLVSLKKLTIIPQPQYGVHERLWHEIGSLSQLEELKIRAGGFPMSGFGFLSNLINLKSLYLGELCPNLSVCPTFSISSIVNLQNLVDLELVASFGSGVLVDIKDIGELRSLKNLYIYGLKFKSSAPLDNLHINVKERENPIWTSI